MYLIVFFNGFELCLHRTEHCRDFLIQLGFGSTYPFEVGALKTFKFLKRRLKKLLVIGEQNNLLFRSPFAFDGIIMTELKNNILRILRTDISRYRVRKIMFFRIAVVSLNYIVHAASIT